VDLRTGHRRVAYIAIIIPLMNLTSVNSPSVSAKLDTIVMLLNRLGELAALTTAELALYNENFMRVVHGC
jgi:hypothetical protein